MRPLQIAMLAIWLNAVSAVAQATQPAACSTSDALVSILFRFRDSDAQSSWVYKSLRPTLIVEQRKLYPKSNDFADGALHLRFCLPLDAVRGKFTLTAGPRKLDLAARPLSRDPSGESRMTDILLVDQPRPDWVVLKSIERLHPSQGGLPSFDIELFNFGSTHPGGRVRYEAGRYDWSCFANKPGSRVTVQVSLAGQRLRVSSSDPEYPEELVERSAEVRSGYCGGNFDVTADFGPTGRIPPGPTRIRYVLKSSSVAQAPRGSTLLGGLVATPGLGLGAEYFSVPDYQIEVAGEGIWQPEN